MEEMSGSGQESIKIWLWYVFLILDVPGSLILNPERLNEKKRKKIAGSGEYWDMTAICPLDPQSPKIKWEKSGRKRGKMEKKTRARVLRYDCDMSSWSLMYPDPWSWIPKDWKIEWEKSGRKTEEENSRGASIEIWLRYVSPSPTHLSLSPGPAYLDHSITSVCNPCWWWSSSSAS